MITGFTFSFKQYLSLALAIIFFYFCSFRQTVAGPTSLKTGSLLTMYRNPDIAYSAEIERSTEPNRSSLVQTGTFSPLINYRIKKQPFLKAAGRKITTYITGATSNDSQDQIVVNLQSSKIPIQTMLTHYLTTQIPIVMTNSELELKMQEKSGFLMKNAIFSFVERKSTQN